MNDKILPKGELDDSGSFNELVVGQFSKLNVPKIRYEAIQLRPEREDKIKECDSEQGSEEHDCVEEEENAEDEEAQMRRKFVSIHEEEKLLDEDV